MNTDKLTDSPMLHKRGTEQKAGRRTVLSVVTAGLGFLLAHNVCGKTLYVDRANPTPALPYASWASAATNIQNAVDASVAGDVIVVTNGVYATGARVVGGMSNRVAVTKPVMVQSVNGPEATVIKGYQVPGTTNGTGAIRCVYLANGAVLSGFMLTNGATDTHSNGGGVFCESAAAVLTNCTLSGNSAYYDGGGSYSGTLNNCTLSGNSASSGGGSSRGTLNNCTLSGNLAFSGGGTFFCTLTNCTLSGNSATWGGGSYSGTLTNCALSGNSAYDGGGASGGSLNNCTLSGNSATWGGGASGGTLTHCTLLENSAYYYGGGASGGTMNDCTLSANSAESGGGTYSGTLNNCTLTGNKVLRIFL